MNKLFFIDSDNPTLRMHECGAGEYWFYHKGSYPHDNPLLYKNLIDSASREIIIWDPYFNVTLPNRDQEVFSDIKNDVTIKILVSKGLDRSRSYINDVHNALKLVIPSNKNCRLGLRVINKGDTANHGDKLFHDRFLMLDNSKVYLVGGSVGHHVIPQDSTGIFEVHNAETKEFIKSIFKYYWDNSSQYEHPVSYLHL